jgi:metallo-beta-lactamase family protein
MCSGGRIVDYLKALIEDERSDILLVGYQAVGTPGRALQEFGPKHGYVELDGRRYDIKAGVYTLNGYSAHADRDSLIRFVKRMRIRPGEIRLIHGDEAAKKSLQKSLHELFPETNVLIP